MTTTETPDALLKLARYIYWQYMEEYAAATANTLADGEREKCLRGDKDHQHGVQIALRSIRETTRLAAEMADAHGKARLNAKQEAIKHKRRGEARDHERMAFEAMLIGGALRTFAHLKETQP